MSLSYTFDADKEGWIEQTSPTDPATYTWDSTTGSPTNGSLKVVMPSGGDAENPNGQVGLRVTFAAQTSLSTDAIGYRYRVNNTGASRTFSITFSNSAALSYNITPTINGDSGWVTEATTAGNTASYVYLDITIDSQNDVGDYTFYVDTVTATSKLAGLLDSQSGIPGGILIA